MSEVWETKDGRRRVRQDPPTVEEAVLAAQGLTDETSEQIEIVASLMEVSVDEARGAVLRLAQRKDVNRLSLTITGRAGASRAVVVERKTRRPLRSRSASGLLEDDPERPALGQRSEGGYPVFGNIMLNREGLLAFSARSDPRPAGRAGARPSRSSSFC